jgi:Protein of unknown function (DUF3592)
VQQQVRLWILLIGIMFSAVGCLSGWIAVREGSQSLALSRDGIRVPGEVKEYPYYDGPRRRYSRHKPAVDFTTLDGREMRVFVETLASEIPRGSYPVVYLANHPERARLDIFRTMWLWPSISAGVALLFWLIGLPILVKALRNRN